MDASTEIEVDYTVPHSSPTGEVRVPPLSMVDVIPQSESLAHYVGFVPSPGFRIAPFADNLADESVKTISADGFTSHWPADESALQPASAFVLASPSPLRFRITPARPARSVTTRQTLSVQRSRLRWSAELSLDVQQVAAAMHRLFVTPTMTVDSVSVKQDGAERLVHWSRTSDGELTLFLSDELTGRQAIQVSGWSEMPRSRLFELPDVHCDESRTESSELRVSNETGWLVDLLRIDGEDESEVLASDSGEGNLGNFTLSVSGAPTHVRITPGRDAAVADQVAVLHADGPTRRLATHLRVQPVDAPLERIEVLIPEAMAQHADFSTSVPPAASQRIPDGRRRLTFDPQDSGEFQLSMTAALSQRPDGGWSVPSVEVATAVLRDEFLVVGPGVPLEPRFETGAARAVANPPQWVRPLLPPTAADAAKVYQGTGTDWVLAVIPRPQVDVRVPLVESILWYDSAARRSGVSTFWLNARNASSLSFQMPRDADVQRVTVNDSVAGVTEGSGRVDVPVGRDSSFYRVTLWWVQPTPVTGLRQSFSLPRLQNAAVDKSLVRLLHSDDQIANVSNGMSEATSFEWDLARLDTLLEAVATIGRQSTPPQDESRELFRAALSRQSRAMSGRGDRGTLSDAQQQQQEDRLERAGALVAAQSAVPSPEKGSDPFTFRWQGDASTNDRGSDPFSGQPAQATALATGNGVQSSLLSGSDSVIGLWMIDRWLVRAGVSLLILGVLLVAWRWLRSRDSVQRAADWLLARPAVGLLLLGALWWSCGAVVLGVAAMLVGVVWWRIEAKGHAQPNDEFVLSGS